MKSEQVSFAGSQGGMLAARLDSPDRPARAQVLFAHCFTCDKDIFAATRIAQALVEHDIASAFRMPVALPIATVSSTGEWQEEQRSAQVADVLKDAFVDAKHPKSFISLADADHLLRRPADAVDAANIIAAWSERYVD